MCLKLSKSVNEFYLVYVYVEYSIGDFEVVDEVELMHDYDEEVQGNGYCDPNYDDEEVEVEIVNDDVEFKIENNNDDVHIRSDDKNNYDDDAGNVGSDENGILVMMLTMLEAMVNHTILVILSMSLVRIMLIWIVPQSYHVRN